MKDVYSTLTVCPEGEVEETGVRTGGGREGRRERVPRTGWDDEVRIFSSVHPVGSRY